MFLRGRRASARALFRRGANFTAAMVFEIASTNLVIELGIIMALLLGWQFTAAEFVGGPIMIVVIAVLFRLFLRQRLLDAAKHQADKGLAGSMEGHAAMDMSVKAEGSLWSRLSSAEGFTSVSHIFVMEWAAVLRDIVLGLLIAGAVGAWVPDTFWQHLFLTDHPLLARIWGPLLGPVISIFSFVCSIGNVPLAAVLWNGGISFGGVVSFIFADLIIVPILVIYRKYYGTKMMLFILGTFYANHGHSRLRRRGDLRSRRADSFDPQCRGAQPDGQLELHDLPQYRLHRISRSAGLALLQFWRSDDAQNDGWEPRTRDVAGGFRPVRRRTSDPQSLGLDFWSRRWDENPHVPSSLGACVRDATMG